MLATYQTPRCVHCGGHSYVDVDLNEFAAWRNGALIQDVWPEATPEWRETMISGTHAECWESMFGDDDEQEE